MTVLGMMMGRKPAAGGGGWSPLDLTNLVAWYDASDAGSFTYSSGSVVSQWNDLSSNGYHMTQATVANQPSRDASLNSLAGVTFDGTNDRLTADAGSDAIDLSPWTFWAVVDLGLVDSGGFGRILAARRSATGANDYNSPNCIPAFRNSSSSGVYAVAAHSAGTASADSAGVSGAMIIGSRQTGTSLFSSVAGVESSATTVTAPANMRYLRMGSMAASSNNPPDANSFLSGAIFEMFICNDSVTDADALTYLEAKWNL